MEKDKTMLPVREMVWLEGKAYLLAWIRQITYLGILMPVEPVYISVLKGQLSPHFGAGFMVVVERGELSNEPHIPEPALYTLSMQDDSLQTGSRFGKWLRPWATKAVKPLCSSELNPCPVGSHAEALCLFRASIMSKVYCGQKRTENAMKCNAIQCNEMQWDAMQCNAMQWNEMKWVTSTKMECYCER